jgi:2-oxoisovalerate dehydrogenase E1 component
MPLKQPLAASTPWVALTTTAEDWRQAEPDLLAAMLNSMVLIRAFEEKVLELAAQGLVHGPAHSAIGQEAAAVGSVLAMRRGDQINGSHRSHHQFLAKAFHYIDPSGICADKPWGADMVGLCQRALAEILGLAQGFCRGRGGSMHLRWAEAGNLGTNAIVGGGVPMAAGAAWAHKRAGTSNVAFTYFGDGAINIGSVLETMNLAAAWKLPLCFFIENNRYAVSTSIEEVTAEPRLSSRGLGFGIPSWKVDGMDALAIHLATQAAVELMRHGEGPTIIEADVYRYYHQNGPLPGSAFGYRSKMEEESWRRRDPIDRVTAEMVARNLVDGTEVSAFRKRAKALMDEIAQKLIETHEGKNRIVPNLWPSADFRDVGIRGDLSEFVNVPMVESEAFRGALAPARFIDAIANVMMRRMGEDERIVVMGEDVHRLKGGTNGATRGLHTTFPDRVMGTPIAENAFIGLAGGIALDGRYVPVVEFMYSDFLWVAADQLFNQIAKARHMFGGDSAMPLVLRAKVAMGTGYGSQHSMDPAGIFATSVGWRIVAPSSAYDYIGLMNSALMCRDPVLVLEHVDLYSQTAPVPVDDLDYCIPLGKAKLMRRGNRMTILTYLSMVHRVLEVVERLKLEADVIDLRSLDRAGIDWALIESSIARTGNVVIVEQGSLGPSYGGWLSDQLQHRCFDMLDQPIQRVHGSEASPSISKVLEAASCAGPADIERALCRVMAEQGLPLARIATGA